jgi:hypothetical protein
MSKVSRKTLALGGRDVRIAALSFRQLEDLKGDIDLLMSPDGQKYTNPSTRESLIKLVIASSAAAADPVDRDFLLDSLTIANFNDVGFTLFDRNGWIASEPDQGEARATPSQIST